MNQKEFQRLYDELDNLSAFQLKIVVRECIDLLYELREKE